MKHGLAIALATLWVIASQATAGAQSFDQGLAAARAGDFAAAVAQWRPLAKEGHAEAQFSLGAVYESGLGVPEDPSAAAGWYAQAAGQGHAKAQYNLAVMYADGRGVPRDDTRAATWMRKAAEQNHGKAQYNLGVLYQAGRGVPQDPAQARIWFDRAAANGVVPPGAGGEDPAGETSAGTPGQQPDEGDFKSKNRIAPVPDDSISLNNGDKHLEPGSDPSAVKSAGLSLSEAAQTDKPEPAPDAGSEAAPAPGPDLETSAGPEFARLSNAPLRIEANFADGARYRIEVTETRERARDGGRVLAQTSQMRVDMVIKPGRDDGALIEWTYGPATVKTAGDPSASRLASELGKLIDGQVVAYHTNRRGEVTELGNPGQLSSFYQKSIDRVLRDIDAQTTDPKLVDDIRANLVPLLSEDYASSRALDLPKLLHFFSGLELAAGETYSRAGEMNLPPSAQALPSTVDYELKWFDRAAGVAWLSWRQSVDPDRAASAVKSYIETLAARSGQPTPAEFNIGDINVSDSADYEIDLATGFPKQVIYTRKVELFGFSQTEKRRVRVLQ